MGLHLKPSSTAKALVSIVMPACNAEKQISESVQSVVSQTFPHWELLIIDDGSTDSTRLIARNFESKDPRIRLIGLQKNQGVAHARSVGIASSTGRYLAFLDSDDLWLPLKLERQVEFMKRRGIAFSFTEYRAIGREGQLGPRTRVPEKVDYNDLLKGNVIGCLTVMIDRSIIGPFAIPRIDHAEDFATWLQILKQGYTAWGIKEDLARYRLSPASLSANKFRAVLRTWGLYREVEQLPTIKASWYFGHQCVRAGMKHISYFFHHLHL